MESALTSLILFTVGLFAAVTITTTFLETQDSIWTAEQARQADTLERNRTGIEISGAETQAEGAILRVKVRNTGQVKLADFDDWDVIVEYYSAAELEDDSRIYHVAWLPYAEEAPDTMQWTVSGIYLNADAMTTEVFDPGILNPDEELVIQAWISPTVAMTTTNRITISSLNGIYDSTNYVR